MITGILSVLASATLLTGTAGAAFNVDPTNVQLLQGKDYDVYRLNYWNEWVTTRVDWKTEYTPENPVPGTIVGDLRVGTSQESRNTFKTALEVGSGLGYNWHHSKPGHNGAEKGDTIILNVLGPEYSHRIDFIGTEIDNLVFRSTAYMGKGTESYYLTGWHLEDPSYYNRTMVFYEGLRLIPELNQEELNHFVNVYTPKAMEETSNGRIEVQGVSNPSAVSKEPIGRVLISQDVPLFRRESNGTYTAVSMLDKEGMYRLYGVEGNLYNVGGDHFILNRKGMVRHYVGRVMPDKDVPLYDPNGKVSRMIKGNEAIRVYEVNGPTFDVGGGYYIENKDVSYVTGYIQSKERLPVYDASGQVVRYLEKNQRTFVELVGTHGYLDHDHYVIYNRSNAIYAKN